jgi:hypothetical protein
MSDDERITRLAELARRVWPDKPRLAVKLHADSASATVQDGPKDGGWIDSLLLVEDHPRALDMLEAALLVGAGDAPLVAAGQGAMSKLAEPAWVEPLAAAWEAESLRLGDRYEQRYTDDAREEKLGEAYAYDTCAEQLRERAKS